MSTRNRDSLQSTRVMLRRHEHLPAEPPVARVHDHVADTPRLVVHKEILDMSDIAVRGRDVVADHGGRAPEMRIAALLRPPLPAPLVLEGGRPARRHDGEGIAAPQVRPTPVRWISVIPVVLDLLLPRHRP